MLKKIPHQAAGAGLPLPTDDAVTLHGHVQHRNTGFPERQILLGQGAP